MNELRRATYNFAGDAEIAAIPLYVRYNRARRGDLRVGDACPDLPLLAYSVVNDDGSVTDSTTGRGPVLASVRDPAVCGPDGVSACGASCGSSGVVVPGVGDLPVVTNLRPVSLLHGPHMVHPGRALVVLAGSYS